MILTKKPDDSLVLSTLADPAPRAEAWLSDHEKMRGFVEARDVEGAWQLAHEMMLESMATTTRGLFSELEAFPAGMAFVRYKFGTGRTFREDAQRCHSSAKNLHKMQAKFERNKRAKSGEGVTAAGLV